MRSNLRAAAGLAAAGDDETATVSAEGGAGAPFILDEKDLEAIDSLAPNPTVEARLCWKTDPLKMLDFE